MIGVTQKIEKTDDVVKKLRALRASMREGYQRSLQQYANHVAGGIREVFDSEGQRVGWSPLSQATLRRTPDRKGGPLVNTGELRAAAIATRPGVPHSAYAISRFSVTIGVTRPDAAFHQEGTKTEPARPFLRISEEESPFARQLIAQEVHEKVRRAGLQSRRRF